MTDKRNIAVCKTLKKTRKTIACEWDGECGREVFMSCGGRNRIHSFQQVKKITQRKEDEHKIKK